MNHAPLRELAELLRQRYPDATLICVKRAVDGESAWLSFENDAWQSKTTNLEFKFRAWVAIEDRFTTFVGLNLEELQRNILDGSTVPSRPRA